MLNNWQIFMLYFLLSLTAYWSYKALELLYALKSTIESIKSNTDKK